MTVGTELTVGTDRKKRPNIVMMPIVFKGHTPIFVHLIHHLSLQYSGEVTVTVISAVEVITEFSALYEKGVFGGLEMCFISMFTPIDDCVSSDPKLPVRLDKTSNKWRREFEPFKQKVLEQKRLGLETEIGNANCIIADCYLHFSKEFSDKLGIPWIPVYTLPSWLGLSFIYSNKINAHPRHSMSKIDLPGLELFHVSDPPWEVWGASEFLDEHRACVERSGAIIVNTPESLELEVGAITEFRAYLESRSLPGMAPPMFYTLGPRNEIPGFGIDYRSKLSSSKPAAHQRCMEWLDKQPAKSVLYIAFGTLANLTPKESTQVAIGLEASGATYLWNLKVPANSSLDEMLPAGFLERTKDQGYLLTGWAPQVKILLHPALGGFMTHCGWNSTTEGLCSGIPLIASPCFADQCMNARAISERWKVGVALTPGYKHDGYDIKSTDVKNAIRALMFEDIGREARKNAEEVKKRLLAEVSEGGSSYEMMQGFLKYITTV